jgi:hypothetical protein
VAAAAAAAAAAEATAAFPAAAAAAAVEALAEPDPVAAADAVVAAAVAAAAALDTALSVATFMSGERFNQAVGYFLVLCKAFRSDVQIPLWRASRTRAFPRSDFSRWGFPLHPPWQQMRQRKVVQRTAGSNSWTWEPRRPDNLAGGGNGGRRRDARCGARIC